MKRRYLLSMAIGLAIAVFLTALCPYIHVAICVLALYYMVAFFTAILTNFGYGRTSSWQEATTEREGYWEESQEPTPRIGGMASGALCGLVITILGFIIFVSVH